MTSVLDASALLAWLTREPGHERVQAALQAGAVMHLTNLAEVLSKLNEHGRDPAQSVQQLQAGGVLGQLLQIEVGTLEDAVEGARLRPMTKAAGLSLGDRCCLALARRLQLPALTADRTWSTLDLGTIVEVIRQ